MQSKVYLWKLTFLGNSTREKTPRTLDNMPHPWSPICTTEINHHFQIITLRIQIHTFKKNHREISFR